MTVEICANIDGILNPTIRLSFSLRAIVLPERIDSIRYSVFLLYSISIFIFLFIVIIYSFIDLRQNKIHGKWRLHVEEPPFLININNYYLQSIFLKYALSPL